MKLTSKTVLMAALVAGGVFSADIAAPAQNATNPPPATVRPPAAPGARGQMNFESIARQLSLTDDQKTKARPVFQEMLQKMAALRQDITVAQPDRRAKNQEIRDTATTKLKEILTQEQFDIWTKLGQGTRRLPAGGAAAPATGTTPPQK